MASVAVDNNIYVFGGKEGDTIVNKNELFNTSTELWTAKENMPYKRYGHEALYNEGYIYICSGYNECNSTIDKISVYDVESDIWLDDISTPNSNTSYASGIFDGELYIFGGKESGEETKKSYKYNFQTEAWTELSQLPKNLFDEKAVRTQNGFYIFSQWDIIEYDAEQDSYNIADHIPREVEGYAVASRDVYKSNNINKTDAVYITGGHDFNSTVSTANTKVRFIGDNSETKEYEWFNDMRLIRGLSHHNMIIANGYIYIYGGQVVQGTDQRLMFKKSIYEYPDDVLEPTNITENTDVYGSINYDGDSDTFLFTPAIDGKYEVIQKTAIHSNNPDYRWHVEFSEYSTGKKLSYCYIPQDLGGITLKGGTTYALKISDKEHSRTGNYTFKIKYTDYDDAPDEFENALKVNTDCGIYGHLDGVQDRDFFCFDIKYEGDYELNFQTNMYKYPYKLQITYDGQIRLILVDTYYPYNNLNVKLYSSDNNKIEYYNLPHIYSDPVPPYYPGSEQKVESTHLTQGRYYISIESDEYDFADHEEHDINGLDFNSEHEDYTFEIVEKTLYNQPPYYARMNHNMVKADNKLYIIGGYDNSYNEVKNIESYSIDTNSWQYETEISIKDNDIYTELRKGFSSIAVDDRIYNIGGYIDMSHGQYKCQYYNDINVYNTSTKQWSSAGNIIIPRERAGIAVNKNNIYIIGGRNESGYLKSIEVFNTDTNTVSAFTDLPCEMIDVQAYFYNDILYIIGGTDYNGYSNKVYALENGTWVKKSSMPYSSKYMRGKSCNGDFVCAAVNSSGNVDLMKYDTNDNSWSIIANDFLNGLIYYNIDVLNGYMYIMGGYSYESNTVVNNTYTYDCITDTSAIDKSIPIRSIGFEYEQGMDGIVQAPEITDVDAKIIDKEKGVYQLTVRGYSRDPRSIPFFFWSSKEGTFTGVSPDYKTVTFYADPGTGDRDVKVVVGMGDGRGYVSKKSFKLPGNKEKE